MIILIKFKLKKGFNIETFGVGYYAQVGVYEERSSRYKKAPVVRSN